MTIKDEEYDMLGNMMAWENRELDEEDTIELFQRLINTGEAWILQGMYGRTAKALIELGYCHFYR